LCRDDHAILGALQYEKHQSQHAYTKAMITAVTKCGQEKGSHWTDAISLLQKWGSIIKKKFKDASLEGNNILGRRPHQLEKLDESVAKLLHHRIDAVEQSARNANAIRKHTEEITSLNTKVSALQEFQTMLIRDGRSAVLGCCEPSVGE
jgi:hypothetical protein